MYRALLIITCSLLLVSCNATKEKVVPPIETDNNNPSNSLETSEKETDNEKENGQPVLDLLTPDGIPPIETTSFSSPFGDDGNMKFKHTAIEVSKEFMDEDGRIYFNLDENPIRHITSEDGVTKYIANYYDAFIAMMEAKAYDITEQGHIDEVYQLFISNPPKELEGKDPSDYRSWAEATNLERGIMATTDLLVPYLNHLGYLIEDDMLNGEQFDQVIKEFELLGSPLTIIPAPQAMLDLQLYDNISMIQSLWRQLAEFENPVDNKDEFEALYNQIREEMNHMVVRINYALSEN